MSVYYKEKQSIDSALNYTYKANGFVIVCDGIFNEELYKLLEEFKSKCRFINVKHLKENQGLEKALNEYIKVF